MHTESNDDRMTSAPVWGEFVRFSVPSVLGMLAISSATIVDGLVVGNYVGAEALAAVTIVMPMLSVLFAPSRVRIPVPPPPNTSSNTKN